MTELEVVRVDCYSGHSYAQGPRAFTWRGERYVVITVERTYRTPAGPHFRVRTESGPRFELAYDERADEWLLAIINDTRRSIRDIDKEVNPSA